MTRGGGGGGGGGSRTGGCFCCGRGAARCWRSGRCLPRPSQSRSTRVHAAVTHAPLHGDAPGDAGRARTSPRYAPGVRRPHRDSRTATVRRLTRTAVRCVILLPAAGGLVVAACRDAGLRFYDLALQPLPLQVRRRRALVAHAAAAARHTFSRLARVPPLSEVLEIYLFTPLRPLCFFVPLFHLHRWRSGIKKWISSKQF